MERNLSDLSPIWESYLDDPLNVLEGPPAEGRLESCYRAILSYREGFLEKAHNFLRQAQVADPSSLVAAELNKFLAWQKPSNRDAIYATPNGFNRFIRGGGNIELYENLSKLLREVYSQSEELKLLDIGAGDGHALLPSLTANVEMVDIVEPSAKMLADLCAALDERRIQYRSFNGTLQEFIENKQGQRWDIIQATYSLHSISTEERMAMLDWICRHGETFIFAEFDVPEFQFSCEPDSFHYFMERFEKGLSEYEEGEEREIVAQEFLMPVLLGNLHKDHNRVTFEQTMESWKSDLKAIGFQNVELSLISHYWWADSYLVKAKCS